MINTKTSIISLLLLTGLLTGAKAQVDSHPNNAKEISEDRQPAEFPGGMTKFYRYIAKNLRYPADARRKGIEGKVYVEFEIDSTGAVIPESVHPIKGIHPGCDVEAVRVIKKSPAWIPGYMISTKKPISTKITLPITFKLG